MRLAVTDLTAGYGKIPVLNGVALNVDDGEVVAVIGPNGAGKTTLLKTLAGVLKPAFGSIRYSGTEVAGTKAHVLAQRGIALVPEGRHLFPRLTVRDNLILAADSAPPGSGIDLQQCFDVFPVLESRQRTLAGQLSGGEQQMAAIARAMLLKPKLLMLDEPSIGLAPRLVREVMVVAASLATSGLALLIVEQNAREVMRVADRVYVLVNGKVAKQGSASELSEPDELRRLYLGL